MNRITLMGRITVTPELKEGNGTKYCNFSIAVDRVKKSGNEPVTDFFNCTAFGQSAEFVSGYMIKGQRILVSGPYRQLCFKNRRKEDGSKCNYRYS